jgi:hypothetical protein
MRAFHTAYIVSNILPIRSTNYYSIATTFLVPIEPSYDRTVHSAHLHSDETTSDSSIEAALCCSYTSVNRVSFSSTNSAASTLPINISFLSPIKTTSLASYKSTDEISKDATILSTNTATISSSLKTSVQ